MDLFDSQYFRVNKLLLSFLGLWPYQTPNIRFLILSFSISGGITNFLPQVIYLFKESKDIDEVFEMLPATCGAFMDLMKIICFSCNVKKFKVLLRLTQENWSNLSENQETQIITRYAEIGRKFTLMYLYGVTVFVTCYASMPLIAPILDIISPLNETRPRTLLFPMYYLSRQEKYYYVILLSEYISFVICILGAIATDTTYFWMLGHICGMQAVLCNRLKNLKPHCESEWIKNDQTHGSEEIGCRVRHCVELDKRIRVYVQIMKSTFEIFLLTDIAVGTLLHTGTCIMIVIREGRLYEIIRYVAVMLLQSIRFLFISWTGQQVTDHSTDIQIAAYNAMWYLMPIKVQKMLMLLIARSQNPSRIILAGIYTINLESFSWVMKTSVSYCTIMISVRDTTQNT